MQTTSETLVLAFATLLPALVFLLLPLWRGGSQLFTIQVSPEFLLSPRAAHLKRTYRVLVITVGLLAFLSVLRFVTPQAQLATMLAPLAEIVALACAWGWAWNSTMPHRVPHAVVRTASLSQQEPNSAAWWLSTLPAILPLALAACYLQLHWAQIPPRYATHFGLDGTPNGFTFKSSTGVYWPLALGAVMVLLMSAIGYSIARFSPAGSSTLRKMTMNLLRMLCWFLALLFCMTGLLPLSSNAGQWAAGAAIASVGMLLGVGTYVLLTLSRDQNFDQLQQSTSEQYWKWGIFYYNPGDAAILVPKRLGFGYTLNFGHPVAWVLGIGLLAVLAIPAVLHSHVHLGH